MRVDRARRRVVVVIAALLALCWATPAGAADDPPQITEAVPIRIHGTDTNWPPVLVFLAAVVVIGGIFVCIVFMRRVRQATRADRSIR
jgi:TRAP-type C4-dicarboxylate transport system permease small subunit